MDLKDYGSNYVIYYVNFLIDGEELIEVGKIKDKQEAFPIIRKYLLTQNKEPRRYIVIETDEYTTVKNGNNTFRLYKI